MENRRADSRIRILAQDPIVLAIRLSLEVTLCVCVDVHVCMDKEAFTLVIQCDLLFSYY